MKDMLHNNLVVKMRFKFVTAKKLRLIEKNMLAYKNGRVFRIREVLH